ncbi:hypothetical protein TCAL_09164 [Tigriopus californicus]|uniref:Uncharacterized protein n=1 Tax=Tigriopus californicus TaxID=6832 RepID=A0A553N6W8_TIGCA|nr:uncharacterized protein LOC131884749 [Tigriopus californicus]XP_059088600.1 uncharacterized protein LOC131884749 [Tigriopus californicus]XP_059088601.1 uncharacterized protein LOC131884749 [Tigriopus californicus]XP_059088602.1 uncharacterized protein LOC131884749 [Tigriopus californicus]TRY61177.1 hypothetical protein TCAL_09164 [Tigriopus californicus]|eukprot:TCALIF_09164-PA protein Name:"Protein of unknown function" AED:0.00 eAED:0.00 QI:402/1/1/1/0.33/0.25/4/1096/212
MIVCTTQNHHTPLSYHNEVTNRTKGLNNLDMGNICPIKKNNNQPPKDLNALLSEVDVLEDMESSHWIQAFRTHLKSNGREDIEPLLYFVAQANILNKLEPGPTSQWKQQQINEERLNLVISIGNAYFSEDSSHKIALSNRILWNKLSEALQAIQNNNENRNIESDLEDACQLIRQAKGDYKVWKGGVDKAYNAYLASKPSLPTLTAVLLSIL